MKAVFDVRNLSVWYGEKTGIKDVTLQITGTGLLR